MLIDRDLFGLEPKALVQVTKLDPRVKAPVRRSGLMGKVPAEMAELELRVLHPAHVNSSVCSEFAPIVERPVLLAQRVRHWNSELFEVGG